MSARATPFPPPGAPIASATGPEFVAELSGLPPAAQYWHAAGVLSQTFALRAALGDPSPRREVTMSTTTRAPFRCRVLRWHRWSAHGAPHHGHVRVCRLCGREQGPFNSPDERPAQTYPNAGM
jgi:hypothetical protein